ncbi:MAG: hypothetical protein QOF59_672 [Actinomycetota bacterium]|nr:hypothetical protein [Actinomycetota bacterium]
MKTRPDRLLTALTALAVAVAAASACTGGHGHSSTAPSTAPPIESPLRGRPLPVPVQVRHQPEGATLADPAFRALAGARAEYGRLGGSTFQIEIPATWNGRLVLWMHGFADLADTLHAGPPKIRRYLVSHGFAWAASSFSSTSLIPGRAADETAALWDYFVTKHGRPMWTYAMGLSMGGWATHIVAERYANRFDGALGLCGAAGTTPGLRIDADFFVAAAFVAGVTQAEYDAAPDIGQLIDTRILPALERPAARTRFENIVIDLTGGPRAFDNEGIGLEWQTKWRRARLLVSARLVPPRTEPYRLGPTSDVTSSDFNAQAIRLHTDEPGLRAFSSGIEVTGNLAMPLLTMHTTGDEQVPIDQAQVLHARVHAAGRDALLVQRVVKDPGHCGFSSGEQEAAFAALQQWVEHGARPEGTNLDRTDLLRLDRTFELVPRPASSGAQAGPGDVTLTGTARLGGRAFDSKFIGAVVLDRGLVTPCNVTIPPIVHGTFELTVYGRHEAGCGRSGSKVALWTYVGSQKLFSTNAIDWPASTTANVTVDFSTSHPSGAAPSVFELNGEAYGANLQRVRVGARVEAFIGSTLCGVASVRTGVFDGYILHVVGPDAVPGCRIGAQITFRVDGAPVKETVVNGGTPPRQFDLTVR